MDIEQMHKKRAELIAQLEAKQTKLSAITNLIRSSGLMPREKYKQCCDSQQQHKEAICKIMEQLRQIKSQIIVARASLQPPDLRPQRPAIEESATIKLEHSPVAVVPTKEIVEKLVALRSEYQSFAADFTRVSSMRQMAAEFVVKLNPIIRRAVNSPDSI